MKKIVLALFTMLFISASIFAQSDLQVLAVVKHNKSESITVKELKKRVGMYEKEAGRKLTVDERKDVLDTIIKEKLVVQAANKAGLSIPDSVVNQYFEASISQNLGFPVTEKQFSDIIKEQYNISADEFFNQSLGISKSDFKETLRTQVTMQQYIMSVNESGLKKVAPTDEQIRKFYDANKSNFIWNDMVKMLLVAVPNETKNAKVKANELRNNLAGKKVTSEKLKVQSQDKNAGFVAGEQLLPKNQLTAQILGMTMEELLDLFSKNVGYVSEVMESEAGYTFVSIVKKYDAKMLGIGDLVQPETTVTVYDYIRAGLTQQLQAQFLQQKLEECADSLNTSANVERKKTGAALDKLLDWGD